MLSNSVFHRASRVNSIENIRRVKDVLKETGVVINMDRFIDILARKRALSVIEEREIRQKQNYNSKMEAIFDVLLGEKADEQYGHLIETLRDMNRSDILEMIQEQ